MPVYVPKVTPAMVTDKCIINLRIHVSDKGEVMTHGCHEDFKLPGKYNA